MINQTWELMKEKKISIALTQCTKEELSEADRQLVDRAIEATHRSYSRYSHFSVGAALRLANGNIVIGANQENAAFPSGLCAERTALFSAGAQQPDQPVVALAIAGANSSGLMPLPVTPCGACRQVMIETEDRYHQPIKIILYGTKFCYVLNGATSLMPLSFIGDSML